MSDRGENKLCKQTTTKFADAFKLTKDPMAAAVLVLSESLQSIVVRPNFNMEFSEVLSHTICMGIRHGLFGASAGGDVSLNDGLSSVGEMIPTDLDVTLTGKVDTNSKK